MADSQSVSFEDVHQFVHGLLAGDLHARRVLSLVNATLGVITSASLAVSTIGQGLALARGLSTKHAIKQVDRLLSNHGIDVDAALRHWVRYVVAARTSINVALDWTDFDADKQATIMLSLLSAHGRATPLMWLTVDTSTLKNRRNQWAKPRRPARAARGPMPGRRPLHPSKRGALSRRSSRDQGCRRTCVACIAKRPPKRASRRPVAPQMQRNTLHAET